MRINTQVLSLLGDLARNQVDASNHLRDLNYKVGSLGR